MRKRLNANAKLCVVSVAAAWMMLTVSRALGEDAAGYFVHIDPVTGKPTAPTPGTVAVPLDARTRYALSTSFAGLQRTPSPVPGGGYMINLQGRFQHGHVAIKDKRSGVLVPCLSGIPHDHDFEPTP